MISSYLTTHTHVYIYTCVCVCGFKLGGHITEA